MPRYVMVLRVATSLRGALEGVGPETRDFFWALKWYERSKVGTHRSGIRRPKDTSSQGHVVQETYFPRDALSKGLLIQGQIVMAPPTLL
jgi:hypothetical protein